MMVNYEHKTKLEVKLNLNRRGRGDITIISSNRCPLNNCVYTSLIPLSLLSWTSPEGEEFHVSYVADELGYRVMESNAVPENSEGLKADGNQGAFEDEGEEGEGGEK